MSIMEPPRAPQHKSSMVKFWNDLEDKRMVSGFTKQEAIDFAASLPAAGWMNIQIRITS